MRRLALLALGSSVLLAGCGGASTVTPTPQTVVGSLPTQTVAAGDPAKGKQLFDSSGCGGCHTFKAAGSSGKVGPDLDHLAADAKKANQGTLDEYVKSSILDPNSYIVPGYPSGVMPQFAGQLSDQQVADLVAFLVQNQPKS